MGGFAQQNVWRTTDAGGTWASRSGTGTSALPGVPVYSHVIHPSDLNTLYVGTDIGIFFSTDAGATWVRPSSGPATVSTDELIFLGTPRLRRHPRSRPLQIGDAVRRRTICR